MAFWSPAYPRPPQAPTGQFGRPNLWRLGAEVGLSAAG